ncbi:hypothetical protein Hanom_Chr10g00936111 [Helianthus anomalus]
MSFYVFICVELDNYEKIMFCMLNMKIGYVLENAYGVEVKILKYDMIENCITKMWAKTVKKRELSEKVMKKTVL